ncbi:hypothetical protein GN956_G22858 [Arapaima gigas]
MHGTGEAVAVDPTVSGLCLATDRHRCCALTSQLQCILLTRHCDSSPANSHQKLPAGTTTPLERNVSRVEGRHCVGDLLDPTKPGRIGEGRGRKEVRLHGNGKSSRASSQGLCTQHIHTLHGDGEEEEQFTLTALPQH